MTILISKLTIEISASDNRTDDELDQLSDTANLAMDQLEDSVRLLLTNNLRDAANLVEINIAHNSWRKL